MTSDQPSVTDVATSPRSPDAVDRDRRLAIASQDQWLMLVLSLVILAASFLLNCTDDGHVRLPLVGIEVPGVCMWRQYTGLDCPGCGLSRCFICLAHGDLAAAVHYHPFGVVLFVMVVAQLPYRGFQLGRIARGRDPWTHPLLTVSVWLLLAGLIVQWLLKIFGLLHL